METEKLLLTTANQSQAFLKQLDTELREIRDVALYKANRQGHIVVEERGSIDYRSLWNYLNSDAGQSVTMFHYIGHSSAKELVVHGTDDNMISLSKQDLAGLFKQPEQLRFVFLNSCCSKAVADELLKVGVPYVIGTTETIGDTKAVQVATKFYEMLGDVFNPRTIEEAFQETQIYFDNDPLNPIPRPERKDVPSDKRGSIVTELDEPDLFPWQLHPPEDLRGALTEAQRTWRLVPKRQPPVIRPSEVNVQYIVTPASVTARPFSFLLSYTTHDQHWADELVRQIRAEFQYYGSVASVWSDESLSEADDRARQLNEHSQQVSFIFMLVNDAYWANPVAGQVIALAIERNQSGQLVNPPVAFITDGSNVQAVTSRGFSYFQLSGEPVNAASLGLFSKELYKQWMKWFRQNRTAH